MASFNCFKDCMNCNGDSISEEHPFKIKKEKKFLTLAKNVPKTSLAHPFMMTFSSVMTEPSKTEEMHLQKQVKVVKQPRKIRQYSSLSHRDQSLSKRITINSAQNKHQSIIFSHNNQRPSRSIEDRQRRYSLGKTPKPNFTYICLSSTSKQSPKAANRQICARQLLKKNQRTQELTSPPLYHMNEIREVSEERQKCSSLFQGARSIVSRMVTSTKKEEILRTLPKEDNSQNKQIKLFYDSARLCQTQHAIIVTHSSLADEEEERKMKFQFNRISLESIPMSPHSKSKGNYENFKVGRLIGVGKWAHLYLCQQSSTLAIFVIKQIFKEILAVACSFEKFKDQMNKLSILNHSNLMSIYGKFETSDKLCLILEYCSRCLFEQLRDKGPMPIVRVRKYSEDLIKAVIYLHDNQVIHGNINIFQVFDCLGEGKLKHSLTRSVSGEKWRQNRYKNDIEGLAIIIFQFAYGLIPLSDHGDTLYEKEKLYCDYSSREKILQYVKNTIEMPNHKKGFEHLNNLIRILLNWDQECRLTSSLTLDHPFFKQKNSNDCF